MKYKNPMKVGTGLLCLAIVLIMVPRVNADQLTVRFDAADYRIEETGGYHVIHMDGFGYLDNPGEPLLPSRKYHVLLPPGARVVSVEVEGEDSVKLSGHFRIKPAPPIVPLINPGDNSQIVSDLRDEWERNNIDIYQSNEAYPQNRGQLVRTGGLRKYSFALISFNPFSYYPEQGILVHYKSAVACITYDVPHSVKENDVHQQIAMNDTLADAKAQSLFINADQIKKWYAPVRVKPVLPVLNYDYVIIAAPILKDAIESSGFIGWKTGLGYKIKMVFTSDHLITGQPGHDLGEKIRNFLRTHYLEWGIKYVLLVGDYSTIPMRYCFPDPTIHTFDTWDPTQVYGEVPTDYYYADLSAPDSVSWDSDGDGYYGEYMQDTPDFMPDVFVGRIPINLIYRVTLTLQKIVAFEQDKGSWKQQALHPGSILFFENQNNSGYPFLDGATMLNSIETDFMSGWSITHLSEQEGIVKSSFPWTPYTDTSFADEWRTGRFGVVNWSGHGMPSGVSRTIWTWDDGDSIPESWNSELAGKSMISNSSDLDTDYPSITFAISCNVGYPEPNPYGNIGVRLLTHPTFGAASAMLCSTRPAAVSGDWLASPGGVESYCYEFNRLIITGSPTPQKIGEALYNAKYYSNCNYGWDHVLEYQNLYNYNLYGDPSMAREGR